MLKTRTLMQAARQRTWTGLLILAFVLFGCAAEKSNFAGASKSMLEANMDSDATEELDTPSGSDTPEDLDSKARPPVSLAKRDSEGIESTIISGPKAVEFVVERVDTDAPDETPKPTPAPLKTMILGASSQALAIGEKATLILKDENGNPLPIEEERVSLGDEPSVDQNGAELVALKPGETIVTVTRDGYEPASVTILVTAAKLLAIAFDPSEAQLREGDTLPFTVKASFTDGERDVTALVNIVHDAEQVSLARTEDLSSVKALAKGETALEGSLSVDHPDGAITQTAKLTLSILPALIEKIAIIVPEKLRVTNSFPLAVQASLATGAMIDVTDLARDVTASGALSYDPDTQIFTVTDVGEANITLVVHRDGQSIEGRVSFDTLRAPVASIAVLPGNKAIAAGSTLQYKAMATLADGSQLDVTRLALWTSSDPSQAAFPDSDGKPGLIQAMQKGASPVTMSAQFEEVSGQTTLTVRTCTTGTILGVWKDPAQNGIRLSENFLGDLVAYSDPESKLSAAQNYNYYSASAHPIHGPEPKPDKLNVFLFKDSEGVHLNFFANLDEGGSADNKFNVDITTTGNLRKDRVVLSDDGAELNLTSSDDATASQGYEGRFQYWKNSDGAVVGPFTGESFNIHFRILATGDIVDAAFHSAGGESFSLLDASNTISSFIVGFRSEQTCQ